MDTQFFSECTVDKGNRPPFLNKIDKPGNGLSPSMKAVQMWALLRYLPLVIGHAVPEDDIHWLFLLDLCVIVDLVFAQCFTLGMISYLHECISDHLSDFKSLFGEVAKLRPKHHLLVHFPSIVLKNGPLVGTSCLR